MKIAFTVCSLNHFAKAQVMIDSFKKHNPQYEVYIGLMDRVEGRLDKSLSDKYKIIEIEQINIPNFTLLCQKYDGLEMSCLCKPYFANYLLKQNSDLAQIIYMDSDVKIYNSFASVEQALSNYDILITPHIFSTFTDHHYPKETSFLNAGVFNGGFFALKRSEEAFKFLDWWQEKLNDYGYANYLDGMFVDQLWLNFVPIFFKNVCISYDYGLNAAYWNLHERTFKKDSDGNWFVNDKYPLVFFHFSGFPTNNIERISVHTDRFTLSTRPDLKEIFEEYRQDLIDSKHAEIVKLPNKILSVPSYLKYGKTRDFLLKVARKIIRELHG